MSGPDLVLFLSFSLVGVCFFMYLEKKKELERSPRVWLVTGVAGFIGSNLLESLLKLDQIVIGIDNFSTGKRKNFTEVQSRVSADQWARFRFHEEDIRDLSACHSAMFLEPGRNVDYVLHQAALGSVPRSLADPISTNSANIDGFLNVLVAARDANVKKFVYAASSSTYGDHPGLPKVEDVIGNPLSPYAVTKYVNELYAQVFGRCYGLKTVGLRYFNVFGQRQDPDGAYAAVIPKWISSIIKGDVVYMNGDGTTSRDFCYIDNTVQANILAALADRSDSIGQVFNVAVGDRTSLNELFDLLASKLSKFGYTAKRPEYRDFRPGDVKHSLANIDKARGLLGYEPEYNINQGLSEATEWYVQNALSAMVSAQ